jgi:hypothetical protein
MTGIGQGYDAASATLRYKQRPVRTKRNEARSIKAGKEHLDLKTWREMEISDASTATYLVRI